MSQTRASLTTTSSQRTNEEWVAALSSNDASSRDALSALTEYLRRGLRRALANHRNVDDSLLDDFTQDALVKITTRLESFRGDSKFTTWAMAIAIRVALSDLRRRHWGDRSLDSLGITVNGNSPAQRARASDPTNSMQRGDLLTSLRDAIEHDLTPRQRAAIQGELAGMPTDVLAKELNSTSNALYKLHHDARRRLKSALEERGFSESEVRSTLLEASNR